MCVGAIIYTYIHIILYVCIIHTIHICKLLKTPAAEHRPPLVFRRLIDGTAISAVPMPWLIDGLIDGLFDGWIDGLINGWIDCWIDGLMDGWID